MSELPVAPSVPDAPLGAAPRPAEWAPLPKLSPAQAATLCSLAAAEAVGLPTPRIATHDPALVTGTAEDVLHRWGSRPTATPDTPFTCTLTDLRAATLVLLGGAGYLARRAARKAPGQWVAADAAVYTLTPAGRRAAVAVVREGVAARRPLHMPAWFPWYRRWVVEGQHKFHEDERYAATAFLDEVKARTVALMEQDGAGYEAADVESEWMLGRPTSPFRSFREGCALVQRVAQVNAAVNVAWNEAPTAHATVMAAWAARFPLILAGAEDNTEAFA